ncbi:MAG: ATP-dependent Clp protease ATP-binding subunit [Candidatus Saccharibacteria bacterium]|nr:ATP-dependent Clp protease ATP-binding subunit [Candidatus Saccharibacteria bacterium]
MTPQNQTPLASQSQPASQTSPLGPVPQGFAINPNRSNDLFDHLSLRAREARLGQILGNTPMLTLNVIAILACLAASGYSFYLKNPLGWLCLGLASLLMIIFIWTKLVLKKVPVGRTAGSNNIETENINDVLSPNALCLLSKDATVMGMAKSLPAGSRSGRFLMSRYAIGPEILQKVALDLQRVYGTEAEMRVFSVAKSLRRELNGETVSGGMLEVAMISLHPQTELLLASLKLELSDLKDGITWYSYLHGIVKTAKVKRRDGGIARDLSFGYIPLMSRFGRNISISQNSNPEQVQLEPHMEVVSRMIQTFSTDGRQNTALIGPDGTGKNTIVRAFAWEILSADNKNIPSTLKFRQVFQLDSATILGQAPERGQVERLVTAILNEAYAAKNIILYFKDAHLFFEEGVGSVDISNLLLPALENGALRIILTMDEQKYLEISAKNPALANSLNKIMVAPANEAETLRVMQDAVPRLEYQYKVTYTIWALKEAYRLSSRYVFDLEMPGRALHLLESAASYADHGFVLAESVGKAIEKTQGVKVQVETDTAERNRLLNMENLIHERMIDQAEAVKTVSDALRRSAAGVRNTSRPIGTFLFLGPTGVGKTELAKAVSQVYFGGENDIVRIDLNEYVSADDVSRLIAEPTVDPMSLTAQMMKNPFSVVLLDEIEKAHPQVLTTLLQMLDEGILRDTKNREVSFRDAIVIATSNAGADRIRAAVSGGEDLAVIKEELTNTLIKNGEFKPEFLNRFDEICIFKPLSKEDLRKIAALLVKSTNKTLANQKITVKLTDEALDLLVEKGYDPQLGARPMRRVVQKTVENIVAKLVLAGTATSGAEITITPELVQSEL